MISVVIPYFRAGHFLGEAIESVLNQTEKDWELILVDNNASEDTREVAQRYARKHQERIRVVHESRQGSPFSRNRGIIEAKGKYIALLDDDDIMYPDRLANQKKALQENPEASVIHGLFDRVSYDNSSILDPADRNEVFPHFLLCSSMIQKEIRLDFPNVLPSTSFFIKEVAINVGLFDIHFSPCILEDTEFFMRMYQKSNFIEIPSPILRYRSPSGEFLRLKRKNNLFFFRNLLNQDYFFKKICELLEKKGMIHNSEVQKAIRIWRSRWLKEAAISFLGLQGGSHPARTLLFHSLVENPMDFSILKHLIRSIFSDEERKKKYRDDQITDEQIPEEISEQFLSFLFSGGHHCEFCKESHEYGATVFAEPEKK